jgi:hypothetical protein
MAGKQNTRETRMLRYSGADPAWGAQNDTGCRLGRPVRSATPHSIRVSRVVCLTNKRLEMNRLRLMSAQTGRRRAILLPCLRQLLTKPLNEARIISLPFKLMFSRAASQAALQPENLIPRRRPRDEILGLKTEMQHYFASMRTITVLEQVKTLPGPEHHLSARNRDRKGGLR